MQSITDKIYDLIVNIKGFRISNPFLHSFLLSYFYNERKELISKEILHNKISPKPNILKEFELRKIEIELEEKRDKHLKYWSENYDPNFGYIDEITKDLYMRYGYNYTIKEGIIFVNNSFEKDVDSLNKSRKYLVSYEISCATRKTKFLSLSEIELLIERNEKFEIVDSEHNKVNSFFNLN